MQVTLAEKSYEQIRKQLIDGQLPPGTRLVNRKLAEQIGVSMGPIREAINRLASEGLVEQVPGAGAFVRQADRQDLEELYVLRDALESCAAGEAALHISPGQLADLESIVETWEAIAEEIRQRPAQCATQTLLNRWLDGEEQFHETIVQAARNRLLTRVIVEHRAISQVFAAQRRDPRILTLEVAKRTCADRRELLAALAARDAERSRQLMSDQIQKGRNTVVGFLAQQTSTM